MAKRKNFSGSTYIIHNDRALAMENKLWTYIRHIEELYIGRIAPSGNRVYLRIINIKLQAAPTWPLVIYRD